MYVATTEALARRPAILARGQLLRDSTQSRASLVCDSRAIQSAIHDPIRAACTRISLEPVRFDVTADRDAPRFRDVARRGASIPLLDSLELLASIVENRMMRQAANSRSFGGQLSLNAGERDSWVDRRGRAVVRRLRTLVVGAPVVKVRPCLLRQKDVMKLRQLAEEGDWPKWSTAARRRRCLLLRACQIPPTSRELLVQDLRCSCSL